MIAFAEPTRDETGGLFVREPSPRREFSEALERQQKERNRLDAKYDAAGDGQMTQNIWSAADSLDADSANSLNVRTRLRNRSRYEAGSNGYADGIATTWATDVIGSGPSLQMQTQSEAFNRMVEREWMNWTKEISFRRKLWTSARSVDVDGETFGVLRQNASLKHRIKLDWVIHEADQCTSPMQPYALPGWIDGIHFDDFGNPIEYEFMQHHPGSNLYAVDYLQTELIPARFVSHWYKMNRAGQHRGVPVGTPTLNIGAASRRWWEAVLQAAETAASFTMLLKSTLSPDVDAGIPFQALDIFKNMMTTLPMGYDAMQPKAEQPTANHAEFNKSLIAEQARPRSMPYSKAACDNSNNNFASGKLDHLPYYQQIDDVDRLDCSELVLDKVFSVWFEFAIVAFGWLGGNPEAVTTPLHSWGWPKHPVADEKADADAKDKKLKNGSITIAEIDMQNGKDPEDTLLMRSRSNGLTVDQQRQVDFWLNVPQQAIEPIREVLGLTTQETQTSEATNAEEV